MMPRIIAGTKKEQFIVKIKKEFFFSKIFMILHIGLIISSLLLSLHLR